MEMNAWKALALLALIAAPYAHAQNLDGLTAEEQRQLLQLLLKQQAAAAKTPSSTPSVQSAPATPTANIPISHMQQVAPLAPVAPQLRTEADLGTEFSRYPTLPTGVTFERFNDGFSVNGQRYIDPEGRIISYGFDGLSGDFTYVAEAGLGRFVLKAGRAMSQVDPITIATAVKQGTTWNVTTESGKKLAGFRLIPSSRGFIIARFNTGFRYLPGRGITNFAAPDVFSIAALQSGDISNTGYILLERTPESANDTQNGSLGALVSSIKSLGSTLGMTKKEDYALLNIDTNHLVPVNVSLDDKQVQVMSACRRMNNVVNQCARMDSFDSLFQSNGRRNLTHYFWRIHWFNANGRPILVSQEGGLSKVSATDLNTGRKVILFERGMGIAGFEATQALDGKINVTAQMGFSTEKQEDVATLLDTLPDVSEKTTVSRSQ